MAMSLEQHATFPTKSNFLSLHSAIEEQASATTRGFSEEAGEKLPATLDALGSALSILYRGACCAWGCRGGDHQIEWLTGRVVNQALSSYRLLCAAFYDESLMLTRGIGEIANLLYLFLLDPAEFEAWKSVSRNKRINQFGPIAVRKKLVVASSVGPPIDQHRYQKLCEVGTHPVPATAPGHFHKGSRPILGGLPQQGGIFVCINELGFAIAICCISLGHLLGFPDDRRKDLEESGFHLLNTLGGLTVLNYEELLTAASKQAQK